MKAIWETHGPVFELVRHFLAHVFDSEMFTVRGQWRSLAIGAFALALPAGMLLLDPAYATKYRLLSLGSSPEPFRNAVMADQLALLTLLCAVTGVLGLLQWRWLFPGGRDCFALAPLPVTPRQISLARFLAVMLFCVGVVITLNAAPAFILPLQFTGCWQLSHSYGQNVIAQGLSSGLACFFTVLAVIAIQGLMLNLLTGRIYARISPYVQSTFLAAMCLAALFSWSIADWPDAYARLRQIGTYAPPAWFASLGEVLQGSRDPLLIALAMRALLSTAVVVVLVALTYLLAYRRYRRMLIEATSEAPSRHGWSLLSNLPWLDGRRLAVFQFLAATLGRSRTHRLVLLAHIGAGLGILINSSLLAGVVLTRANTTAALQFIALFWPLGLSVFVISGVRHAFSMPAELPAHWIFRSTESLCRREWMSAVEWFVIAFAIAPIYVLLLPAGVLSLGWALALRMTALQVLVSLTIFEIRFHSWQQLPFTCSYNPGERPLLSVLLGYFGALAVGVPIVAFIIATVSRMTELFLIYGTLFLAGWLTARHLRRDGWGEAPLIYEETPQSVADLRIHEMGCGALLVESAPAGSLSREPVPTRWRRLRLLFHREQLDRDLDDEIAFHMAMREESLRRQGLAREDANQAARCRFGNATGIAEQCREVWVFARLETWWQDVRYGARQLRHNPGFTAVAMLTLGLGIGSTTVIYSVLDAVLWKTMPLVGDRGLVAVLQADPANPHMWQACAPGDVAEIRGASTTLRDVASWQPGSVNIVDSAGEPLRLESARVSANLFDVLTIRPVLGRTFLREEEQPGNDRVVILGDRTWRRHFAGDPQIVGRVVRVNERDYTVVGVMPPDFGFPRAWYGVWIPLALPANERQSHGAGLVDSIGRIRDGHTQAEVAAELNAISIRLERQFPATNQRRRFVAWSVPRYMQGDYGLRIVMLLGLAATFVLLIACTNVASLQLARGTGRTREIAIRSALGAGRRRIIRQLIAENVTLALAGAIAGIAVTFVGLRLTKAAVPAEMRHFMVGWENIGLSATALVVALVSAMLSGVLAGLVPAWRCSRPNIVAALKEGGREASVGRGRHRVRSALIVGEIALATILLSGAAVLIRGFRASLDGGAAREPSTLLTMHLELGDHKYIRDHEVVQFYSTGLGRLRALPGVRSVAAVTALPYSRHWNSAVVEIDGAAGRPAAERVVQFEPVSPEYFATLHIPLRAGRLLRESDGRESERVAVVSQRMADRWWPGGAPLGRRVKVETGGWMTIVGVAGDVETSTLMRGFSPTLYVPMRQHPARAMDLVLRTEHDPMQLAASARRVIREIDPEQPVSNLNPLEVLIRQDAMGFAYMAALMGIFGLFALLMSAVSVYGVMAYVVGEQTHEIGVRVALGAPRWRLMTGLMLRGMRSSVVGLAIGLLPAYAMAHALASVFLGALPRDAVAFALVPSVLLFASGLAIWLPARRALRVEPVVALRSA